MIDYKNKKTWLDIQLVKAHEAHSQSPILI